MLTDKRNVWFIVIGLGLTRFAFAQDRSVEFERLSFEQGLAPSTVQAILQDRRGFIWFGTQDGLSRYDGYSFVTYKHDHTDSLSVSDNFIQRIYEDREHYLWIGTNDGLNRFDPRTGKFTRFKHDPEDVNSLSDNDIRAICEDHAGNLWVGGNSGVNRYERATKTWRRFQHDASNAKSLSHNRVNVVAADHEGKVWIGTLGGGLDCFDPVSEEFQHFQDEPQTAGGISSNFILSLYFDRSNTPWVGTYGGGLNRFDARTETFRHFRYDSTDARSLSDDRVYEICEDEAGRLWMGTLAGGLNRFDPHDEAFTRFQHQPARPTSISSNFVRALCLDRSGNLWIGTDNAGLNKVDLKPKKFLHYYNDPHDEGTLRHNFVNALFEGPDRALWVATNWGVDKLPAGARTFEHVQFKFDGVRDDKLFASSLWVEKSGVVWVGAFGPGLLRYQPATGELKRFKHDPKNPQSLANNIVNCIFQSRDGTLWVGTSRGLSVLPPAAETFTNFSHDPQNPKSLSQNGIACIFEDRAGNIWVGTNLGGLNKFERAAQAFARYQHEEGNPNSLSNNAVTALYEDARGVLWIGTNYGLSRLQRETGQSELFTNYFESDGLPSNYVNGILGDEQGNLWLSTNSGISRFNPQLPKGRQFRNYDVADGLQAPGYFEGSAHQSSSGEMFFGGTRGFNRFDPRKVWDNPHAPALAFTSFKIFDKPATRDTAISECTTLTLSHEDDFFSFEFAALDFTHPQKNRYAYKMEGFNTDWIQSGTRRYVSYTNLDHGTYRFRVKGSNGDGVWNEEGITLRIVITPPFWETWWFRILATGFFAGFIFWLYRHRLNRLLEIERLRVSIASDLHDDIGATLTKISLHTELIQDGACSPEIIASLRKIGTMSRELVTTMSDVVWSIDARNDTFGNLLDRMREFAASVLAAKSVALNFNTSGLELQKKLPVDIRQNLYLIFKEAINNVARHAEASRVDIRLENANGALKMIIHDDGTEQAETEKFTGHGLRNMKMRAQRIGGELEVVRNGGYSVSVSAPAPR